MRKFTKEIATILASMAISTSVTANSASSEELVRTEGVATVPDSITAPSYTDEEWETPEYPVTTIPPLVGTMAASPPTTTSTTTEAVSHYEDEVWNTGIVGTMVASPPTTTSTTTEAVSHYEDEVWNTGIVGTMVVSPPTTTSTTTEAVSHYEDEVWNTGIVGTMVASPPTTTSTTTEAIPPFAGGVWGMPEYHVTTIPPLAGTMVASPLTTTSTTTEAVSPYEDEVWETPEYHVTTMPPFIGTIAVSPSTIEDTETEPVIIPSISEAIDTPNGDVNSDGETSLADALAILQYIANPIKYPLSEDEQLNADVYNTGDGITPMDALIIQKLDAGLYDSLPVEE